MMNPIDFVFQQKKNNVLTVYTTAGYPVIDSLLSVLPALQDAGVDLIEVGIPFSDPLADGPVIQQTGTVALQNGMTLELLFEQLSLLRSSLQVPLILMGYLNSVLQFGMPKFLNECKRCGVSGVILPDLPIEVYESEYRQIFEQQGIHAIFLITPATPEARVRKIAKLSCGFLYAVANAAVTGAQQALAKQQEEYLKRIQDYQLEIPVLTGFGIHDRQTFQTVCRYTSGAIVGSAFLRLLGSEPSSNEAVKKLIQQLDPYQYDRTAIS